MNLNRAEAPPYTISRSFDLPKPTRLLVNENFQAYAFHQVQQALVKIDVVFKAARWHEKIKGISHFTAQMLDKGTQQKNASEVAEWFDQFGAHVESSSGADYTTVSLYSLSSQISNVLPLFIELLKVPSFPESELDLLKGIYLQNLRINREKNNYVAGQLIRKILFGESHPYGGSIEEQDLSLIDPKAIRSFFDQYYKPAYIFITGQMQESLINQFLQNLSSQSTKKLVDFTDHETLQRAPEKVSIRKDDSIQTSIRIGTRSINRNHNDYFSFVLANHLLGGFFGSRLMKNIREEKGLTYGIYSSIQPFLHDSMFVIGADVNKENQEATLTEIKNEIEALANKSPGPKELDAARNHFLGSLQLDMANPFSISEKIKNVVLYQLDEYYYENLFTKISTVTPSQVSSVLSSHVHFQELSSAVVG
jgi:predicted Zn-dependent peptidase